MLIPSILQYLRYSTVRSLNRIYYDSNPKVAGSNPTEVKVMIFRSLGVEKLGRTSSMNIEYTQVAIFPPSLHLNIVQHC